MLIVFEVYVMAGTNPDSVLSEEVRSETMAQIMTVNNHAIGTAAKMTSPDHQAQNTLAANDTAAA